MKSKDSSNEEFQPRHRKTPSTATSQVQLFTSHVTGALNRNKVSDREALRLMIPIVAALGHWTGPFIPSIVKNHNPKKKESQAGVC